MENEYDFGNIRSSGGIFLITQKPRGEKTCLITGKTIKAPLFGFMKYRSSQACQSSYIAAKWLWLIKKFDFMTLTVKPNAKYPAMKMSTRGKYSVPNNNGTCNICVEPKDVKTALKKYEELFGVPTIDDFKQYTDSSTAIIHLTDSNRALGVLVSKAISLLKEQDVTTETATAAAASSECA